MKSCNPIRYIHVHVRVMSQEYVLTLNQLERTREFSHTVKNACTCVKIVLGFSLVLNDVS